MNPDSITRAPYSERQQRARPFYCQEFLVNATAPLAPWQGTGSASGTLQHLPSPANHPGVVALVASAGANSGYSINTSNDALLLKGGEEFNIIFNPVSFAGITSRMGLHNTNGISDAVSGVYFEVDTSGVIRGKNAASSTRTTTATSFQLVAGTWYRGQIKVASDLSTVRYNLYSDTGTIVFTDTLSTNIPSTTGQEIGIMATSTTTTAGVANLMLLDYISFGLSKLTRGGL